jgi:hypothetical protein
MLSVMSRLVACVTASVLLVGAPIGAADEDVSLKSTLAAARRYLAEYEHDLAYLLADESYTQHVTDRAGRETGIRAMSAEIFLTFLPEHHTWIAVRDVTAVDGQPIEDRDDLSALLRRDVVTDLARTLAERNARFNIGLVRRNFNEPTLGLQLLESQRSSGIRFSVARVERDADRAIVTLNFKETDVPTIVHGEDGRPIFATGEVAIEAGTGRIRRTQMRLKYGPVTATLTTIYGLEPKLNIWVPTVFRERYEADSRSISELIDCEANYSNYRRFEVTVRIK